MYETNKAQPGTIFLLESNVMSALRQSTQHWAKHIRNNIEQTSPGTYDPDNLAYYLIESSAAIINTRRFKDTSGRHDALPEHLPSRYSREGGGVIAATYNHLLPKAWQEKIKTHADSGNILLLSAEPHVLDASQLTGEATIEKVLQPE